jgi:hypothetical protein
MGFFRGRKAPKVDSFVIDSDRCLPSTAYGRDTFKPRFVILIGFGVGSILAISGLTKIYPAIIRRVAIGMVNMFNWKSPSHINPNGSMDKLTASVDFTHKMSTGILPAYSTVKSAVSENPSIWAVVICGTKMFLSKHIKPRIGFGNVMRQIVTVTTVHPLRLDAGVVYH